MADVAPQFLTIEQVLLFHELALEEFGGQAGVRDSAGLHSAIAQPAIGISSGYLHAYPFEMAAAYGFHLAKNHPFLDGNKRVAWSVMRAFLQKNGYVLRVATSEAAQVMVDVASGAMDKHLFAKWIAERAAANS